MMVDILDKIIHFFVIPMSNIASIPSSSAAVQSSPSAASSSSGELAKCESQLSDWVNCPSSQTSAGKAKIAEITSKIDAIKTQMKKADDAKHVASVAAPALPIKAAQGLRFDGLGTWVNVQA